MSEMVERVATAIFQAEGRHSCQQGDPWDVMLQEWQRIPYRGMARAAIESMQFRRDYAAGNGFIRITEHGVEVVPADLVYLDPDQALSGDRG
jgi:hypothetical protein